MTGRMMLPLGLMLLSSSLFVLTPALTRAAPEPEQALFKPLNLNQAGIFWVHDAARSEEHYLPETMSGGIAFLDYNQDGWVDLYLVNSGESEFFKPEKPLKNALYRNNGDLTFTDVTDQAGVAGGTFGMGAAVADFDNNGFPDLLVTAHGRTILYRNQDGRFQDVTRQAGVWVDGWTTSAAWFDFDNDGLLDLFICSFVEFSRSQHISCGLNPLGKSFYCVPRVFTPTTSRLFRNRGDGTFEDVSDRSVIGTTRGKALGVVSTDVNNDGRMDLFVANDTVQDFLFLNRGEGRWDEVGLLAGVGLSNEGAAQSGMGVDAADVDQDGWQDLFVANIDHQYFSLFKNTGAEAFEDQSVGTTLGKATFLLSGWGLRFFDFDLDGDPDLIQANGHPDDMIDEYASDVTYREPLLLFENQEGVFQNISGRAGTVFSKSFPARGLATGDIDNDGRVDVAVANIGEPPLLLRNLAGSGRHWLGLRLVGRDSNRDGVGARISWSVQGVVRSLMVNGGGSYLSAHDARIVLGLGESAKLDWVEIRWPAPSSRIERWTNLSPDRYHTLEEGTGQPSPR